MKKSVVLGVDIGGSHITAALIDLETGKVVEDSFQRKAVDSRESAAILIETWTDIINKAFTGSNLSAKQIGIAMPGPFDYDQGISLIKDQGKFRSLYELNIKKKLADSLQISTSSIKFINDAKAFVKGEIFSGAAKGYQNVLGITLGTGLGTGISIDGKLQDAELWDEKFLGGIAEDYFSTRWFVGKYESLTGKSLAGVKELAGLVDNDPFAKQVFNEFGRGLGHFLADVIKKYRSEIVVLGGNISGAFHLFEPHLLSNLEAYHLDVEVKVATLNEQATLIGAASQWDNN